MLQEYSSGRLREYFLTPVSSDRPEREKYAATIFHDSYERCLHHQVTNLRRQGSKSFTSFIFTDMKNIFKIHLFLELFLLLLLHSRKHNVIQQDLLDAQKVCFQNNLQKNLFFLFFPVFNNLIKINSRLLRSFLLTISALNG